MADSKWSYSKKKHFKSKVKNDSQEGLQKWKEHFKNLFGYPPEINDKTRKESMNG